MDKAQPYRGSEDLMNQTSCSYFFQQLSSRTAVLIELFLRTIRFLHGAHRQAHRVELRPFKLGCFSFTHFSLTLSSHLAKYQSVVFCPVSWGPASKTQQLHVSLEPCGKEDCRKAGSDAVATPLANTSSCYYVGHVVSGRLS